MSDDKNPPAQVNNIDEINKNKILISLQDYQFKHGHCLKGCFPLGGLAFLGSLCILPYALKAVPYVPLTLELRVLIGILSTIPVSYITIKRTRERCEKRLEDTYYYKGKQ